MSCSNCDCEECDRSKHMNDDDEGDEEMRPSTFGRLPPPPPFHRTSEEFRVAMHSVFDRYPNVRLNMPAVVSIMIQGLNVKSHEFKEAQDQILGYLKGQADNGVITITKGKNGGIMRSSPSEMVKVETKKTIEGPIRYVGETLKVESPKAINNHTCPGCGNTKCSKDERSCWKCGGSL